jgi:hypothetical protein
MFGHVEELNRVNIDNKAIYTFIKDHLTILDNEYGYDRDTEEDDGGYILYCERGTTHSELASYFEYEESICEYTERIPGTDYYQSMFILNNEYVIVIVIAISDAPSELLDNMIGG